MTTYLGTTHTEHVEPHTCGQCGVVFGMTRDFIAARKRDRKTWYCPNGDPRIFTGESDATKLERAEAREVALKDQLGAAVREAETVRVALLRDRQRFANGVCPCCNRSFDNVRRHMTTKHPDFDPTRVVMPSTVRFSCSCGRSFGSVQGLRIHQGSQRSENWDQPGASRWGAHLTKV